MHVTILMIYDICEIEVSQDVLKNILYFHCDDKRSS